MKFLIFDAGPLISLAMIGLLDVLRELKKNFNGEFIITPDVKKEVIDKPYKIKKYKLESIQIKALIDEGILKYSREFVTDANLRKETSKILKEVNGALISTKTQEKIKIIQDGEANCLAFANLCNGESIIVVDERTTRIMIEAPEKLENMIENKLHIDLDFHEDRLKNLRNYKFIRSSELLFLAYKKGLMHLGKERDVLDALLYGVKFKGTAISMEEIEKMKRMI